jgi:hypothetical protein
VQALFVEQRADAVPGSSRERPVDRSGQVAGVVGATSDVDPTDLPDAVGEAGGEGPVVERAARREHLRHLVRPAATGQLGHLFLQRHRREQFVDRVRHAPSSPGPGSVARLAAGVRRAG